MTRNGQWGAGSRPRSLAARGAWGFGLILLAAAGGCSSTEELLGTRSQPAEQPAAPSPSFADRFRSLFGSGESASAAPSEAQAAKDSTAPGSTKVNCPPADIRHGAGTLQMNAPGNDQALGVRYQATFSRTARQCAAAAGTLTIKVGVQGRLILGPAGSPGETKVPLRYALVQEGIQPKTIWSKLYLVPVAIAAEQPSVPFTHVVEDLTVPLPSADDLDHYVIYIGFDPQGAAEQSPPKRGAKPKSG